MTLSEEYDYPTKTQPLKKGQVPEPLLKKLCLTIYHIYDKSALSLSITVHKKPNTFQYKYCNKSLLISYHFQQKITKGRLTSISVNNAKETTSKKKKML